MPRRAETPDVFRVERACVQLAAEGRPVTFDDVAVLAKTSRTTLYRRPDLRALVEEHRAHGGHATTLSGLAVQIDQLRHCLEAVADKVRRHEETIRRIERRDARAKTG
jgi:hypothetical protein